MFDFDASKLLIIGVVALVVIGPKDLPRVLRQVGQMVGKIRRMAAEFQGQFMDAMKEADLADLQKEVSKLKDTASIDVNFNPVHDIKTSITTSVGSTSSPTAPRPLAEPSDAAVSDGSVTPASLDRASAAMASSSIGPTAPGSDPDPVVLELAEPAHHTVAETAGAVHAIDAEAAASGPIGAGRRRVVVPKRRSPGDRLTAKLAFTGRGRSFLPPRRDPRT